MLGRKIAKTILIAGAAAICVLLILFAYVSSKVKNEFEHHINAYFETIDQENKDYQIVFKPFVCSGFFSYECKSSLLSLAAEKNKIIEIEDLILGFKDIETKSMKEYVRGKIKYLIGTDSVLPEFIPQSFDIQVFNKVLNQHKGEVFSEGNFKVNAKNMVWDLQLNAKMRSEVFANKNIIKIMMQTYSNYKNLEEDFWINVQKATFATTSKDAKDILFNLMKEEDPNLSVEEYDKIVSSKIRSVGFLLGMLGVFDTPYSEQILSALGAYEDLFEGKIQAVEMGLIAKEEDKFFNIKALNKYSDNPNDIQRLFAKLFNYYDLSVEVLK